MRCQAFVESSKDRCRRNVIRGSKYCWSHQPTGQLFASIILGALLSLLVSLVWDYSVISSEERELLNLRSENSKLNQRLDILTIGNDSLLNQNKELLKQNDQLLNKVVDYQSVLEQQGQIVKDIKDYSYIARLGPYGKPFVAGGPLTYTTSISRIMEPAISAKDGKVTFNCDEGSKQRYKEAINQYPKFPFSYYALSACLRQNGDMQWQGYALKALSIFEKTTEIVGHQTSHDEALTYLRSSLNKF